MSNNGSSHATAPATQGPRWRAAVVLIGLLAATAMLSQFFRASGSVIGPELIHDLALSPQGLGFANGSYFLAVLLAQVPVGLAFDRIGPRKTVAALTVLMVVGAIMHASVTSGAGLAAARFLIGLGCSGSFMAAVVLIARWYPRHSWTMALSWVFALSQIGFFLAGLPLAAMTEWVGWRPAFLAMGVVAAVSGLLFLLFVRDYPPGSGPDTRDAPVQALGAIEGLRRVFQTPGLLRVLSLFLVAYASFATVMLLWAGPYLNDVHGLETIERGRVLLGMAVAQTIGALIVGPLDRIFNTRKWVVVGNASVSLTSLTALATVSDMPLSFAVFFLLMLSAASGYGTVLLTHIRSHFTDSLAGRGATTGNMVQLLGASLLPIITGFIPPLFAYGGPGYSPLAYQWIFATLAISLAIGLAIYLTASDAKPRQVERPDIPLSS